MTQDYLRNLEQGDINLKISGLPQSIVLVSYNSLKGFHHALKTLSTKLFNYAKKKATIATKILRTIPGREVQTLKEPRSR